MRLCVFSFCFLGISLVRAGPITIDQSTSPDGRYFLSLEETVDQNSDSSDALQVRRASDQNVMGSFHWSQFGRNITPTSAKAVWSPNSSAFALTWYMTRGWTGTELYAEKGSKWSEVVFPDYPKRFIGKNHIVGRGKGRFAVDKWVSGDVIKMIFSEGTSWDGLGPSPNLGDVDENDSVFFRIFRTDAPKLEFLRLEARHEHSYDL